MNFAAYWLSLLKSNSSLADDSATMRISVRSFRRAIERAYNQGDADRADKEPPQSIFGSIFGGR